MSHDADYLLALELQRQFNTEEQNTAIDCDSFDADNEIEEVDYKPASTESFKLAASVHNEIHPRSNLHEDFLNRTQNLVHPQWEILDPTPDVFALFGNFNNKFFQGRLKCVSLEWSKRMYSCAGICYSRRNHFGMDVTIRLSEPLLKLRPRKDLIETMLHEMIHAYCFVLNIREGNGGHGPNFKKIMHAINKVAGTNITVYHTFHDEVDVYKVHWWRCNGICQNRKPFYGYIKRTSNRAPSSNDQWWSSHQSSCGGTFMKIKGPEKSQKNKKGNKSSSANAGDLRKYIKVIHDDPKHTGGKTSKTSIEINTKVNDAVVKPDVFSKATTFPPTSYPGLSTDPFNSLSSNTPTPNWLHNGGNLKNVVGFRDLKASPTKSATANAASMSGRGYTLLSANSTPLKESPNVDRNKLRALWASRFEVSNDKKTKRALDDDTAEETTTAKKPCPTLGSTWLVVDDDIMLREPKDEIITLSSDEEEDCTDSAKDELERTQRAANKFKTLKGEDRERVIKQEILDDLTDLNDEDIQLIDDEYDDEQDNLPTIAATELADTSIVDEFFGEDTLLKEFQNANDVVPCSSRYQRNPNNDIITCAICQEKMKRSELCDHLDGCTGIREKIKPSINALKKLNSKQVPEVRKPGQSRRPRIKKTKAKDLLLQAGYTEADLANIIISNSSSEELDSFNEKASSLSANDNNSQEFTSDEMNEDNRRWRQRSIYSTKRQCPVCAQYIEELEMNQHLDKCLHK